MFFKVIFALAVVGIPFAQGYSGGAPDSECSTMTPRHHVDAQKGPMPYDIILDKKAIKAGDTVLITVQGRKNDDFIKGLLVQARVGETPIGSFDVSPSRQFIQLLNCGNGKGNAVTHKKIETDVNRIQFKWVAPKNLQERVVFYVTVAKNGGVFWVAQKSDTLNVK